MAQILRALTAEYAWHASVRLARIAGLCLWAVSSAATADETFWYEVTIEHGTSPYEFYGSSALDPKSFAETVAKAGFVRLDNLMFRHESAGATKYRPWKEWDPIKRPYIYLNTKHVIAVHPLVGDPGSVQE